MKKLLLLAVMTCGAAHAEFKDGNKLYSDLTGTTAQQMVGMGYVMGVADALSNVTVCAPPNVTAGQVTDMVRLYLEEQPQLRHFMADSLVNRVLSKAWPCKKGQSL